MLPGVTIYLAEMLKFNTSINFILFFINSSFYGYLPKISIVIRGIFLHFDYVSL